MRCELPGRLLFALLLALAPGVLAHAEAAGSSFDEVVAPGNNYDKAEFRLWIPGDARVRATAILVPGSNGDGRAQVDDPAWQAFATAHQVALVGVRLTDKRHDQPFIEHYVNVSQGSGQALLDALAAFSARTGHPEIASAPLLLWGMSAGGQFNYEFTNWKPERVIGFVVNKGGIYYTALTSQAARSVPGLLFIGGKDLDSRVQTITGLFALNRRGGALWALAEEPAAAHVVGRSRDMAIMFFEDLLPLRLPEPAAVPASQPVLRPLTEESGFIGDPKTKTTWKVGAVQTPVYPTAWLPTLRLSNAWRAMLTEQPFAE